MSATAALGDAALDEGAIGAAFERVARGLSPPVVVLAETTSTSDVAKALAKDGAPNGALVVAESQTAGRGRSGNAWHSPPGESLYASIVLRPTFAAAASAAFTLAVGLVVARAVEARLASGRAGLKWPNDVWVGDRKIAGILVEGQVRGDALVSLVVGVGINVRATGFPAPLDRTATSLALVGARDLRRNVLAAELCARVVAASADFGARGLGPLLDEIASRDALRGRRVRVGDVVGRAARILPTGELEIATDAGPAVAVSSGHVDLVD